MKKLPGEEHIKWTAYLPAEMLVEVFQEADRQGRPVSWLLRDAVKIALPRIRQFHDNRIEEAR